MKRTKMSGNWLVVSCALSFLAFAATVDASNDGDSDRRHRYGACERTAAKMFSACGSDSRDNYHQAIANCLNLGSRSEQRDCRTAARTARTAERSICIDQRYARWNACDVLGEDRYDVEPLLNSSITFVSPDEVPSLYPPNPYVSVVSGHTHVLRSGDDGEEFVVVHVTGDTREILGVACRVVVDIVVEETEENGVVEYEAVEVTDDWFAQDTIGDIYYCGEIARNFEDGVLRDLDGSFEAGRESAKAGPLIRAFPAVGDAHRQEYSLGEAEDIVQYVDLAAAPSAIEGGDNPAFPCNPDRCLKTFDFAPLAPESTEYKYYLPGIGFVLAVAMENGVLTGEREGLVCTGDSLDVLGDPACGLADADILLDTLCGLAPDTFCE